MAAFAWAWTGLKMTKKAAIVKKNLKVLQKPVELLHKTTSGFFWAKYKEMRVIQDFYTVLYATKKLHIRSLLDSLPHA